MKIAAYFVSKQFLLPRRQMISIRRISLSFFGLEIPKRGIVFPKYGLSSESRKIDFYLEKA